MTTNESHSLDPLAPRGEHVSHDTAAQYLVATAGLSDAQARAAVEALVAGGYLGDRVEDVLVYWNGRAHPTDAHSAATLARHGHGTHVRRLSAGKGFEVTPTAPASQGD